MPCELVQTPLKEWFSDFSERATTVGRILLLDGGVSTNLEQKLAQNTQGGGFEYRELWSSSLLLTQQGRDLILEGHKDWIRAGCNVISTVTYQCHYRHDLWPSTRLLRTDEQMTEVLHHGLRLARKAIIDMSQEQHTNKELQQIPRFSVASLGCFGAALANGAEYTGDYGLETTTSVLVDFHRRKLEAVIQNETASPSMVDAIAIETVPSLLECQALVDLFTVDKGQLSENMQGRACWISVACRNGSQLNDGTLLQEALEVLSTIPIDVVQAIGLNCCDVSHLPALVDVLVRHIFSESRRNYTESETSTTCCNSVRGLVLYPNSGEIWDAQTQTWKEGTGCTTPGEMARRLLSVVKQVDSLWRSLVSVETARTETSSTVTPSASQQPPRIIMGGCCRTTPTTMKALRQGVDALLGKSE